MKSFLLKDYRKGLFVIHWCYLIVSSNYVKSFFVVGYCLGHFHIGEAGLEDVLKKLVILVLGVVFKNGIKLYQPLATTITNAVTKELNYSNQLKNVTEAIHLTISLYYSIKLCLIKNLIINP